MRVGRIDEQGYLGGLQRKGFTPPKCVLELFANSVDATAKKVTYKICPEYIDIIDNGSGMNVENISNMFAMQRQNHTGHARCGVSGLGGKVAMYILSNQTLVYIFTRTHEGEYLCVEVPWDKIVSEGIYTGQVVIREMTEQEQCEFNLDHPEKHGTTIRFINNPSLRETIHNNFSKEVDGSPLDRIGVIFGKMQIECNCKDYELGNQTLEWYNPLNGEDREFYMGKKTEKIAVYKHTSKPNVYRFICNDNEIKPVGKGFAKEPSKVTENLVDYDQIGVFEVRTALPVNDKLFDRANPCIPQHASAEIIRDVDKDRLGDDCLDFLGSYKLYRNGQLIGLIPAPDIKLSSARGNAKSFTEYVLLQCCVLFNPISNHNNSMDHIANIQENKNQFDPSPIPKQLTRLIAHIKREHFGLIWKYFERTSEGPVDPAPRLESMDPIVEDVAEVHEESVDPTPRLEPEYMAPVVEVHEELPADPAPRMESDVVPEVEVREEAVDPAPRLTPTEIGFNSGKYVAPPAAVVLYEEPHEVRVDPIDVSSHRRGCFHGHEMLEQLERLKQLFHPDNVYVDEKDIKLFNILRSYA
jgi:hypothetical protein